MRPAATRAGRRSGQRHSKSVEVDIAQLASAGYLVPGSPRSALADEFRGIKQPVLKNARPDADAPIRLGNLIMVTSALPGEGKTFCALNLALSIASEVDSSVLLVDADVVRPAILERLGLTSAGQSYKGLAGPADRPEAGPVGGDPQDQRAQAERVASGHAAHQLHRAAGQQLDGGVVERHLQPLCRPHRDI